MCVTPREVAHGIGIFARERDGSKESIWMCSHGLGNIVIQYSIV
jgi:hypothetical protein